jgi:hypothetical protein
MVDAYVRADVARRYVVENAMRKAAQREQLRQTYALAVACLALYAVAALGIVRLLGWLG